VYYEALYEAIGKLENVTDSRIESKVNKQHKVVGALVDREVDAIAEMSTVAKRITQHLKRFASDIGVDEGNAKREEKKLESKIADNNGTCLGIKDGDVANPNRAKKANRKYPRPTGTY